MRIYGALTLSLYKFLKIDASNIVKYIEDRVYDRLLWLLREQPKSIWEIGFSGGKDSTVLLHTVIKFLLENSNQVQGKLRKVVIIYNDTLLEYPPLRDYVFKTLNDIKSIPDLKSLVEVHVTTPQPGEDFFSCMIEKGYPAPHRNFRWCTERLKIRPTRELLTRICLREQLGRVIVLSGARFDESIHRSKILRKVGLTSDDILHVVAAKYSGRLCKLLTFLPLADISEKIIWSYVSSVEYSWMQLIKPSALMDLYGVEEGFRARFGCWTCTLIRVDKAAWVLSRRYTWIKELVRVRELLNAISHDKRLRPIFRIKYKARKGGYGRFNKRGVLCIMCSLAYLLAHEEAYRGLSGYLNDNNPEYKARLKKWIGTLRYSYNPRSPNFRTVNNILIDFLQLDTNLGALIEIAWKRL